MAERPCSNVLICSCEDTMPLDADAVRRSCKAQNTRRRVTFAAPSREVPRGRCDERPLIVGCTRKRRCSPKSAEDQTDSRS